MRSLFVSLLFLSLVGLTGCPKGGIPGVPGGSSDGVNPSSCGGYAQTDVGAKLKGFLEATVQLNDVVMGAEGRLKASCKLMAKKLGVDESGTTAEVCGRVNEGIKGNLSVGLSAGAKLDVQYTPAVCTVNVDVAAKAAAECEGSASADVGVTCEGSCSGTCNGACDGTCEGSAGTEGSGGECNGTCDGTCKGECSGGCEGHADVNASAECKAEASVKANAEAKCTKPDLTIDFAAEVVVDKGSIDMTVLALKEGMPRVLMIGAQMKGPVKAAFKTWSSSAKDLAGSAKDLYGELGAQATCVAGQLSGAVGMIAPIQASMDVQVDVSVSMSASASAEGGASAGN